ncbi:MAG: type IV pilus assembly protein PilM [Patescibacteria group bacterium]
MFFFSKSNSVLGIDIGTSYVKAVQLKKGSPSPILESYGVVNVIYPTESVERFDAVKQTAEILKALYAKAGFTTKKAVISIPSNVAFVSILTVPKMSDKELQKSIEYQAKKYIPLPIMDVNLGWQILEDPSSNKAGSLEAARVKVLLTAVPKNVISNYARLIELAGFEPLAMEPESLSLIRSLVDTQDRSGLLIVDVGAKSTSLSLVEKGYLWSTRHLTVGGDTITATIAKNMGLSFDRADQMKRSSDFGSNVVSPVTQVTQNIIEMIKSEIQQLVRIAENQGKKISKIILTGGGSKISGFEQDFLSLGLKVEKGNPLKSVAYNKSVESKLLQLHPQLAVSMGLALRFTRG